MTRLKGAAHIPTSRTIRCFRSCRHFTGISLTHFESGRIGFEKEKTALKVTLNKKHGLKLNAGSRLIPRDAPFHDRKIDGKNKKGHDMKINCLSCGHKVDLDDVYDDYQGLIRCLTCTAMLEIKTEDGKLRSVTWTTASPSAMEDKTD